MKFWEFMFGSLMLIFVIMFLAKDHGCNASVSGATESAMTEVKSWF